MLHQTLTVKFPTDPGGATRRRVAVGPRHPCRSSFRHGGKRSEHGVSLCAKKAQGGLSAALSVCLLETPRS
jgi:hypothetical protein